MAIATNPIKSRISISMKDTGWSFLDILREMYSSGKKYGTFTDHITNKNHYLHILHTSTHASINIIPEVVSFNCT